MDDRIDSDSELDLYPHWRIRDKAMNGQIPKSSKSRATTDVGGARVKLESQGGVTKASLEMAADVHVDPTVVAAS